MNEACPASVTLLHSRFPWQGSDRTLCVGATFCIGHTTQHRTQHNTECNTTQNTTQLRTQHNTMRQDAMKHTRHNKQHSVPQLVSLVGSASLFGQKHFAANELCKNFHMKGSTQQVHASQHVPKSVQGCTAPRVSLHVPKFMQKCTLVPLQYVPQQCTVLPCNMCPNNSAAQQLKRAPGFGVTQHSHAGSSC